MTNQNQQTESIPMHKCKIKSCSCTYCKNKNSCIEGCNVCIRKGKFNKPFNAGDCLLLRREE